MTDGQKFALLVVAGIIGVAVIAGGGYMATEYWLDSANAQEWAPTLASAESQYGIPTGLLSRIAYEESSFETDVINGTQPSSAGALGMMQLMPAYFSSVQVAVPFTDADVTNQINQAAEQLASLYSTFSNWPDAIAAYNAGATTIQNYLNGSGSLPSQTQTYVAQITSDLPQLGSMTQPSGGEGSTQTLTASAGATSGESAGSTGATQAGATGGTEASS